MFGMSGEHLLILGVVLLVFGPRRLPELGNTLGKAIRNFKDALSGVEEAQFRQIEEAKKQAALSTSSIQTHHQAQTPTQTQSVSTVAMTPAEFIPNTAEKVTLQQSAENQPSSLN